MKYSKIIFASVTILICIAISCKKKTSTTNSANSGSTTNSTTAGSGISGGFIFQRYIYNLPSSSTNTTLIQVGVAYFFSSPVISIVGQPYTDAGTVTINNIKLDKQATPGNGAAYSSDGEYINALPLIISISGTSSFAATTFTDSGSFFPDLSNIAQFPAVISKSVGLSFVLNNLVNTTTTELTIGGKSISFTQNNTLTINPSDLSSVATTTSTTLIFKCISTASQKQTFNGKIYDFNYSTTYYKNEIKIVP
jgi:hypothetical protein